MYSLMYFFPNLEPICFSMSSSNCCFLTCIQASQEAGQLVWYSHLFQNFPQFLVIHTVKGFGIVNKAEIDVFLGPPSIPYCISATQGSKVSSYNTDKNYVSLTLADTLINLKQCDQWQNNTRIKVRSPGFLSWSCHQSTLNKSYSSLFFPVTWLNQIISKSHAGNSMAFWLVETRIEELTDCSVSVCN